MKIYVPLFLTAGLLSACTATAPNPQEAFFASLSGLCGQSFEGRVVSDDPRDADWAKEVLTIHVRDCEPDVIRIPLHVGENRSRTWIVSMTGKGLRLKHDHRHEDGTSDAVTMYGGDTAEAGTATRQSFPVDAESIALFKREGLDQSVTNVWTIAFSPESFTYALDRENRHFKAVMDLTKPVATPPPVWGYKAD